eukprot:229711-Amphidinium_carterae.1
MAKKRTELSKCSFPPQSIPENNYKHGKKRTELSKCSFQGLSFAKFWNPQERSGKESHAGRRRHLRIVALATICNIRDDKAPHHVDASVGRRECLRKDDTVMSRHVLLKCVTLCI